MFSKNNLNIDTKSTFRFIESMAEVSVYSLLYILAYNFLFDENTFPDFITVGKLLLFGIYFFLIWILIKNSDGFEFGNLKVSELCVAQWIGMGIANIITYFQLCLIANKVVNPLPIILLFIAEFILSMLFVIVFSFIHRKLYTAHKMLMVFGSDNAVRMKIKMDSKKQQYKVAELISADEGYEKICKKIIQYESVIINDVDSKLCNDLLKYCFENEIITYVVPKITDILMRGAIPINAFDTPMLLIKSRGLNLGQRILKRAMDIAISLIGLILTSPVMLAIALAIRSEDKGPVFYKQKRGTIGGKEFDILKFRSMIVNAEEAGLAIPATGNDPRITKIGKFIRATRLDELPQLINILVGDMSIVGPRPERIEHIEKYRKEIPEFDYRLKVKGGLTGYAQIYGKYNTSAYDKLRLDLMYIENYSIFLDIKLLIMTARILLSKESTEGFDVTKRNDEKLRRMLGELHQKGKIETEE